MKEKKKRCLLAGANRLRQEFAEFRELKRKGLFYRQQVPSWPSASTIGQPMIGDAGIESKNDPNATSTPIQGQQRELAFTKLATTEAAHDHSHEEVSLFIQLVA